MLDRKLPKNAQKVPEKATVSTGSQYKMRFKLPLSATTDRLGTAWIPRHSQLHFYKNVSSGPHHVFALRFYVILKFRV